MRVRVSPSKKLEGSVKVWQGALLMIAGWGLLWCVIYWAITGTKDDYNACRDKGGSVGFCLTGFK